MYIAKSEMAQRLGRNSVGQTFSLTVDRPLWVDDLVVQLASVLGIKSCAFVQSFNPTSTVNSSKDRRGDRCLQWRLQLADEFHIMPKVFARHVVVEINPVATG